MTRKNIVYFNPPYVNLDALKKDYKKLAFQYHPDRGGSEDAMKQINDEYEYLFEHLDGSIFDGETETTETPHDLIDIIDKLVKIPDIIIEICGKWIWISGNTYQSKCELKQAGCKWASKKKMWYWKPETDKKVHTKSMSMDYIRDTYGSQKMYSKMRTALI